MACLAIESGSENILEGTVAGSMAAASVSLVPNPKWLSEASAAAARIWSFEICSRPFV